MEIVAKQRVESENDFKMDDKSFNLIRKWLICLEVEVVLIVYVWILKIYKMLFMILSEKPVRLSKKE